MSKKKMKNILVSVTGLSPQVVTETLYGILSSEPEEGFLWPDEIKIITTAKGKQQARLGLITADESGKSMLERLCEDYSKPMPKLEHEDILVVPDASGNNVDDAKSKQDQEALADYIIQKIAEIRNQKSVGQLHASIAGGRKTMTFFLGYALSLFAKDGDKLSHVLVDSDYERLPTFYYPTPYTKVITANNTNEKLDAHDAKVVLADIPFIRHRSTLEKVNNLVALETVSYKDLTLSQNAAVDLSKVEMMVNYTEKTVTIKYGDWESEVSFSDNTLALAFLGMIANHAKSGLLDIYRVKKNSPSKYLAHLFICELETMAGERDKAKPSLPKVDFLEDKYDQNVKARLYSLSNYELVKNSVSSSKVDNDSLSIKEQEYSSISPSFQAIIDNNGITSEFFSDKVNQILSKFESYFCKELALGLTPSQVYKKNLAPEKRVFSMSNQQGQPYGLWLMESNVTFNHKAKINLDVGLNEQTRIHQDINSIFR